MSIKGVLREELANSLKMMGVFQKNLDSLIKGSLVVKNIHGRKYYYRAFRKGGKVVFEYLGKQLSQKDVNAYQEAKILRAKYRKSLSIIKKQIKYLRGTLRGKEPI